MNWLKGLLSAAIGGASNSIAAVLTDPTNYNIKDGLGNLGTMAAVGAIVSAAMYLKQSPLGK